jgi:hypothetical protein
MNISFSNGVKVLTFSRGDETFHSLNIRKGRFIIEGLVAGSHRDARRRMHANPSGICSLFISKCVDFPSLLSLHQCSQYFKFIYHRRCMMLDADSASLENRNCWTGEWLSVWKVPDLGYWNGQASPVHAMKPCRRSRVIAPLILNLNTGLRWVINLMLRPFSPGKEPRVCHLFVFV